MADLVGAKTLSEWTPSCGRRRQTTHPTFWELRDNLPQDLKHVLGLGAEAIVWIRLYGVNLAVGTAARSA